MTEKEPKHNLNGYTDVIDKIIEIKPDTKAIIICFKENFPDNEIQKFKEVLNHYVSHPRPRFILIKGATHIIEVD